MDDKFKKLNLLERRKLAIEELVNYYAEYRIYCYNKGDKLRGVNVNLFCRFSVKNFVGFW